MIAFDIKKDAASNLWDVMILWGEVELTMRAGLSRKKALAFARECDNALTWLPTMCVESILSQVLHMVHKRLLDQRG